MTAAQVLVLIALLVIAIVVDVLAWRHVFLDWEKMRLRIDAQDREIARLNRVLEIHGKRLVELGEWDHK